MPSNGYDAESRRGRSERDPSGTGASGDRPVRVAERVTGAVDAVDAVDPVGIADPDGGGRHGSRNRSGLGAYGSDRWARVLSTVTPAAMVAAVGIRIGSAGRRFAPDVAARFAGVPIGVDAAVLSRVAGTVHGLSVLLAVGVACAVGWLVLSATVRLAAGTVR
ncbi:hypothetical protein SAMN04488066_10145 [Halorubrum aquaticum]|uniref:Uncharacterized protein n=1 Tax=Halorubrum aquaticum TaxID=387340 RepID=A0A1I2YY52_9EURY|nr:hypothetical protein [Halorubrum aquaticum]SFH30577.1 hypothetical protein SAMN04488066_10145 [Halorubrum aquaticum]